MSYLDIKVNAIFATTGYLGHQEDAGIDNYRTMTFWKAKAFESRINLRMSILCLLKQHVMKDNTCICNEPNQYKKVNLRHKEVSAHPHLTI